MNLQDFKIDLIDSSSEFPIEFDKYKIFLQEIEVLFNTSRYDVLCSPNQWPNLKDYVFQTGISSITLSAILNDLIIQYCPTSAYCDWYLDIKFMRGELSDIAIIDLTIRTDESDDDIKRQFYIG